ncbi:MAG: type II toxin-antitoxin system PemK/MazF family toxin [Saprospiraceae bacterium]
MKKHEVWTANLGPRFGTEAGKTRPVVIVQTDILNGLHPSTVICPLTTSVLPTAQLLRVHLRAGEAGLSQDSDVPVDQL